MALEKLKIKIEESPNQFTKKIEVLFNPDRVILNKTGWKESSEHGFVAADRPATLTIDLFFDTTLSGFPPQNVQDYTKPIYSLTKVKSNLGRPPRCQLIWGTISGKDNILLPDGFLQQVTKTLTHFWEDGTPVRARLNCTFQEWYEKVKQKKIQNPIDDPIHVVKRGETLSSIAAQEYNDPSLWRIIAQENRINNPRDLTPGKVLTIPPLRTASALFKR